MTQFGKLKREVIREAVGNCLHNGHDHAKTGHGLIAELVEHGVIDQPLPHSPTMMSWISAADQVLGEL